MPQFHPRGFIANRRGTPPGLESPRDQYQYCPGLSVSAKHGNLITLHREGSGGRSLAVSSAAPLPFSPPSWSVFHHLLVLAKRITFEYSRPTYQNAPMK